MNHMTSIARSAGQVCARFTAQFQRTLRAQDSIQQISDPQCSCGCKCQEGYTVSVTGEVVCAYCWEISQ
jgi:hypothetical protein